MTIGPCRSTRIAKAASSRAARNRSRRAPSPTSDPAWVTRDRRSMCNKLASKDEGIRVSWDVLGYSATGRRFVRNFLAGKWDVLQGAGKKGNGGANIHLMIRGLCSFLEAKGATLD